MVSTRRSGSLSSDQLPEPPTTRKRKGQLSTSVTGTTAVQSIAEEEEHGNRTSTAGTQDLQSTPLAGRRTRASGRKAAATPAQQRATEEQQQQQSSQQQTLNDTGSNPQTQPQSPADNAAVGSNHQQHVESRHSHQVTAQHESDAQVDDDPWASISSDDDSEAEQGSGSGKRVNTVMENLAASIRAAFQAKAGLSSKPAQGNVRQSGTSNRQQAASQQAAPQQAASQQAAGDDGNADLQGAQMHWQPAVPLPPQKAPTREVLKTSIAADKEKGLAKQLMAPSRDPKTLRKQQAAAKPDTAGKGWYDLPAQKIDDNMKRELRLLRLRGAYDPKRFYKSFDNTKFPRHFAMGTVVEGPADYYSGRLEAAQRRKATLTEQLMADAQLTQVRKKRYAKLQEEATKHQKVKKRKTELPRLPKSHHRPKH